MLLFKIFKSFILKTKKLVPCCLFKVFKSFVLKTIRLVKNFIKQFVLKKIACFNKDNIFIIKKTCQRQYY